MSGPGRAPGAPAGTTRGDRVLILGLLALLAVAASATPIRNYDYWWHLATGRLILETGRVPDADPFSFTAGGTPWVDHEWLFQVAAYAGHLLVGPAGLVLLKIGAILALALLIAAHLRRERHGPAGLAVILAPALVGAAFRFDVRPEMATVLLLPVVLDLAIRARDTGRARPLVAIPAIAALWANLHVGVVLAPPLLALGAAATWLAARLPPGRSPAGPAGTRFAGRLALAAAGAAAATGLNPYGFRIWAVPFEVSRLLASLPQPNLEWVRPAPGQFPLFHLALVAGLAVLAAGRRRLDPIAAAFLLPVAALALLHLRNVGLFFVLLPYAVARPGRAVVGALQTGRLWRAGTAGGAVRPGFVAAALVLVLGVPALVFVPPRVVWGLGVASDNEPAAAGDFLERENVGRRLFNDVRFGGYLIWRRAGVHPVFVDGRNEIYPGLLREIFAALPDPEAWSALLDRHRIDAAFLRYPPTLQKVLYPGRDGGPPVAGERAFSTAYFPTEHWALVYWDDDAMIYLRRLPEHEAVIARLEYRAIHPDDWRYLFAGVLLGRLDVRPILAEIGRKLEEDPGCRRARRLMGSFAGLAEGLRGARPGHPGAGGH
jgi:hypothetical protein